jgi:TonB family protein
MKALGNEAEDKLQKNNKGFAEPAVLRDDQEEIKLPKALTISTIGHPAAIALIWLLIKGLILLLAFLGINLILFEKPEPKMRDIEFVLVNKPDQKPINPNTRYRADRNQRAGGKHDPTRAISEPEPMTSKSTPQQKASPPPKPVKPVQKTVQKHPSQPAPKPAPPRPTPERSIPKPKFTKPNLFSMPVPRSTAPKTIRPTGGPVTSAPLGSSSPSESPAPVMSSSGYGSTGRSRYSSHSSTSGGNAGNPGPGNPNGAPGIDALKEPDFGAYMRELQRRIKRNWDPPRGNESKRVVVIFKIARDGRLLDLRIKNSSGVTSADRAAKAAVELAAPFRTLPPEYRGSDVDIEFTFDYNVFGASGRRF